jgi:hypothetical protein
MCRGSSRPDGVGGARGLSGSASRTRCADLPLPRSFVHRQADRLQTADHAVDVEHIRLRMSPTRCGRERRMHTPSPTTGTPTATRRRCRPPSGSTTPCGPRALDLLRRNDGRAEGRAHRSLGPGRCDRIEDPRASRRHRCRLPVPHIGGSSSECSPLLTSSARCSWRRGRPESTRLIAKHGVTLANNGSDPCRW